MFANRSMLKVREVGRSRLGAAFRCVPRGCGRAGKERMQTAKLLGHIRSGILSGRRGQSQSQSAIVPAGGPPSYDKPVENVVNDTGWRGSPDVWIGAAYEALLESGVEGVKIMPLAKKLNLSRTSFYWFFPDREALLDALVDLWREKNTGSIIKQANAYADTLVEAVLNVSDCWFSNDVFDSRFEFAMRSWALHSAPIQAEIQSADEQRLEALRQMFARFGREPLTADVCARALYLVQIGYITMQTREDMSVRMGRIAEYVKLFTQCVPMKKELERFYSRHNYSVVELVSD